MLRVEDISDAQDKEMLSVVVFMFHSKAVFVFFHNLNIKIRSYQSNIM